MDIDEQMRLDYEDWVKYCQEIRDRDEYLDDKYPGTYEEFVAWWKEEREAIERGDEGSC